MDLWAVQKRKLNAKPNGVDGSTHELLIDYGGSRVYSDARLMLKLLPRYFYGLLRSNTGSIQDIMGKDRQTPTTSMNSDEIM